MLIMERRFSSNIDNDIPPERSEYGPAMIDDLSNVED